jgi:hypothetical protein
MSQPLHVCLNDEQRQHLDNLIRRGNASARSQNRARILLLADRSHGQRRTRQQIAQATLCSTPTVVQVCRRFVLEGLDGALSERSRPGAEPKITGDVEARLVTLACSDPPQGRTRWTLRLLADKMVELGYIEAISNVAVYHTLKKTNLSPGR